MASMSHQSRLLTSTIVIIAVSLGLSASCAQSAPGSRLPTAVASELAAAHIPEDAVSIFVQAVDADKPTLTLNADRPMNPASVMKVVTTFSALEQLGPHQTWITRIASDAPVDKGVLKGDLFLIGDGDPVLTYERLWRVLRRLYLLGVTTIDGNVVLDHSALVLPEYDPFAFDGKGLRPYNSPADGLLMHFNTQEVALFPGTKNKDPVRIVLEPPLAGVTVENRLTTSAQGCDPWYRDLTAGVEGGKLVFTGSLPASCGPRIWSCAPLAPPAFDAALVRAVWEELGGKITGKVGSGEAPAKIKTLIADESPPLGEIVRTMNKWSNNVIARQLIAQLGRSEQSSSDMIADGIKVATRHLSEAKINVSGLVIENGAGLSRKARIRADTLGTVLLRAWERPWMPEFVSSLPIAGRDGTTFRRLTNSPARGFAHLKTGTVNDVKAIAGFVLDRNGRRHVVVMMVNHPSADGSRKAQDALVEWVWSGQNVPGEAGER